MARRGRVLDVISTFLNNEEFSFSLRCAYKLAMGGSSTTHVHIDRLAREPGRQQFPRHGFEIMDHATPTRVDDHGFQLCQRGSRLVSAVPFTPARFSTARSAFRAAASVSLKHSISSYCRSASLERIDRTAPGDFGR